MMRSSRPIAGTGSISKPIAAIVIPFDETEYLPADVEIRYRDGSTQGVSTVSQFPHNLYPGVTVFMGRFGSKDEEFVVGITVANVVLEKISRRGKRGVSDV